MFWLAALLCAQTQAQDPYPGRASVPTISPGDRTVRIVQTGAKIVVDGADDEPDWAKADTARDFWQIFPYDTAHARSKTEVRLLYDRKNIYLFAACFDSLTHRPFVVQTLKRDFSYPRSDAFAVYFDPTGDKTNGFNFTVSPLNVQREGLIEFGGGNGVTTIWDNRWYSQTRLHADRWTCEMAIPFKSLRYKASSTLWRVNFSRHNLKINENSAWSRVPRNFNPATLAFTGVLIWDAPPPKPGLNVSLIPYASAWWNADYSKDKNASVLKPGAGGDVKVALTPALNLDLTVYPDFSQAEVDAQITNLSRFSIFFPERRQFFIENGDLFANFGFSNLRPFFSRRIGLITENNGFFNGRIVPIVAGARLSGKLDRNWRVGAMNIQTEGGWGAAPQNYTTLAVQRQVFARSNVGAIFVQRADFNPGRPATVHRVAGADFNYFSADNRLQGKAFLHRSDAARFDNLAVGAECNFLAPGPRLGLHIERVGRNYDAQVGFVQDRLRNGYARAKATAGWYFFPKATTVDNHGATVEADAYTDLAGAIRDFSANVGWEINFRSTARFKVFFNETFTYLTFPFDPTNTGAPPLPAGSDYRYRNAGAIFQSDFRRRFSFYATSFYGTYFDGTRWLGKIELTYRAQPWGLFGVVAERNEIRTPSARASLTLLAPRLEFAFTTSWFLTVFAQLNTQTRNINLNVRLQWRFAPMSDVFVVLTENYFDGALKIKNRAVALKVVYWLTL
ncbi:MAG: carbohydrate binding family 9 domain-containing protein [Bacteroidia bacterium]|nr:carbohydrate binding family 9 domain-containing protein [Bacteroidia bacterium]